MTVSTTDNKVEYVGDDAVVEFSFSFKALDEAHIIPYFDGVVQTVGFTVNLNADQDASPGGNVTWAVAPTTGVIVSILRTIPLTQLIDYIPFDAFPSETHETALDLLTMIAQQLDERVETGNQPVDYPSDILLALPDYDGGKGIMWDDPTKQLINSTDNFNDIVTNAAASETNAAASEAAAGASAAAAAVSETNAATSETNAGTSETNAATSETNAGTSETNAGISETNAAASAAAAQVAKIEWQGAYSGATAYALNDAVTDGGSSFICIQAGTGNAPVVGGTAFWDDLANKGDAGAGGGDMLAANNLSDVADVPTSRTNLAVPGLTTNNALTGTQTFDKTIYHKKGANIASAGDCVLLTDGNFNSITGAVTINGFTDGVQAGETRKQYFVAGTLLKHNTAPSAGFTELWLPGAADYTTAAGDVFEFTWDTTYWRVTAYALANGQAMVTVGDKTYYYYSYSSDVSISGTTVAAPTAIGTGVAANIPAKGYIRLHRLTARIDETNSTTSRVALFPMVGSTGYGANFTDAGVGNPMWTGLFTSKTISSLTSDVYTKNSDFNTGTSPSGWPRLDIEGMGIPTGAQTLKIGGSMEAGDGIDIKGASTTTEFIIEVFDGTSYYP